MLSGSRQTSCKDKTVRQILRFCFSTQLRTITKQELPTPKLTTVQSNNNIVRYEVKQALTLISASILFDFKLNVYVSGIKKTGNVWLGPTGSIQLPGRSFSLYTLYNTSHRSSRVPTPVHIFNSEPVSTPLHLHKCHFILSRKSNTKPSSVVALI